MVFTLMTDNVTTFTGKDFSDFAHTWDFRHMCSSPHFPQSNGLAECAARYAKHLMEKCYCVGMGIQAAPLYTHNIPCDGLPSPAQQLLSKWTRTFLPITKAMLLPVIHINVKATIAKHRMRGDAYHDCNEQHLPALRPGQTVRVQTAHGFDRLARVESPASQPNSYIISSQGTRYISNRRNLQLLYTV